MPLTTLNFFTENCNVFETYSVLISSFFGITNQLTFEGSLGAIIATYMFLSCSSLQERAGGIEDCLKIESGDGVRICDYSATLKCGHFFERDM